MLTQAISKHESDRAEKDEEFGALRADEIFFYGDEANVPGGRGGIVVGILAGELRRHRSRAAPALARR